MELRENGSFVNRVSADEFLHHLGVEVQLGDGELDGLVAAVSDFDDGRVLLHLTGCQLV